MQILGPKDGKIVPDKADKPSRRGIEPIEEMRRVVAAVLAQLEADLAGMAETDELPDGFSPWTGGAY
jgi:hypothetical protein